MRKRTFLPYLAGILMSFIFGLSFLAAKIALGYFGNAGMLAWRFTIAALALTLLRVTKVIKVDYTNKPSCRLLCISLIYPVLSFLLEAKGIAMTSASLAGTIISMLPVITLILGTVILKERTTVLQKIMVVLSVAGVMFTTAFSEGDSGTSTLGIITLIGCATCGAVQTILVRRNAKVFSSIEITYYMNIVAALVFDLIAVLGYGKNFYAIMIKPILNWDGLAIIIYLGIFCSVLAFFFFNYINAKLEVARASVFTNLATVISILAGVFLGGEALRYYQVVGMALILLGVWGTNKFVAVKKSTKPDS